MKNRIALFLIAFFLLGIAPACQQPGTKARLNRIYQCRDANVPFLGTRTEFLGEADRIMSEENNFGCAEAVCIEMDDEFPNDYAPFLCRANILFAAKRYAEALPFFDRAVELKPYSFIYFRRARTHSFLGDQDRAIQDADRALQKTAESEDQDDIDREFTALILGHRGYFKLQKNDYESALEHFNRSLEINPNDRNFYYLRAEAHRSLGRNKLADEDVRRADELKEKAVKN